MGHSKHAQLDEIGRSELLLIKPVRFVDQGAFRGPLVRLLRLFWPIRIRRVGQLENGLALGTEFSKKNIIFFKPVFNPRAALAPSTDKQRPTRPALMTRCQRCFIEKAEETDFVKTRPPGARSLSGYRDKCSDQLCRARGPAQGFPGRGAQADRWTQAIRVTTWHCSSGVGPVTQKCVLFRFPFAAVQVRVCTTSLCTGNS